MNHLIIYSNHKPGNYLESLIRSLSTLLQSTGGEVTFRDLYSLNFNPVLTISDFEKAQSKNIPHDIQIEQELIKKSDYLWFVYPIWWAGMPAIIKGYIDRVFLSGFAYEMKNGNVTGLLQDKKAVVINTMGQSKEEYERTGMFKALDLVTDKGIFDFCGIRVAGHLYLPSVMSADDTLKARYNAELVQLVKSVLHREINCVNINNRNCYEKLYDRDQVA